MFGFCKYFRQRIGKKIGGDFDLKHSRSHSKDLELQRQHCKNLQRKGIA
jgi:hypothetical protein